MIVVLDVSGTIEILLKKEKAEKFNNVMQESSLVLVPDLYVSELTNAIWKYNKVNILTKDNCFEYIQSGIDFIRIFIDSRSLWQEALTEGIKNNHSVYDMFYMVTARRNNGILITNDSKLADVCRNNNVEVCF